MMNLIKYDAAKKALAEAHRVDEVKDIRDKAKALEAYAEQAKDQKLLFYAQEIRIRAERRAGELLIEMKERGERDIGGHGPRVGSNKTSQPTLKDLKITYDQSADWQKLAQVSPENFETYLTECEEKGDLPTARKLPAAIKQHLQEQTLPPDELKIARQKAIEGGKIAEDSQDLKNALIIFAKFPIAPEEVANNPRALFRGGEWVIDEHIDAAADWLTRFSKAWRRHNEPNNHSA